MDRAAAERALQWVKDSGIQDQLYEFAYLFVRSALNRILLQEPGDQLYSNLTAIQQNLLGQATAICMLDLMRRPNHRTRNWPDEKMEVLTSRTIVVYAQFLRFMAGMIDSQDAERKTVLTPLRKTIQLLAQENRIDLDTNIR